jgi:hypothetical protein
LAIGSLTSGKDIKGGIEKHSRTRTMACRSVSSAKDDRFRHLISVAAFFLMMVWSQPPPDEATQAVLSEFE